MTIKEYRLNMQANDLRELDAIHHIHLQAWTNRAVKATKGKRGTPRFKRFTEFFNFRQKEDELLGRVYKPSKIASRIAAWEREKHGRE